MPQSFAKVALTPKWIGALFLALAVAAIFAALGQWQLGRALTTVGTKTTQTTTPLETLTKPGHGFKTEDAEKRVEINLDNANIQTLGRVANRSQNGQTGFWQIALATLPNGNKLVIAYDFSTQTKYLPFVPSGKLTGLYLPSEEPKPQQNKFFQSLSVEQLINQTDQPLGEVYPGFVAITDTKTQNPIVIESQAQRTEINALNAFYAVEWSLFAAFAVFLWWRLVQDERLGLKSER